MILISEIKNEMHIPSDGFCINGFYVEANFENRFKDDKILFKNDEYIIMLDGIVLNKKQLCKENADWGAYLLNLYKVKGNEFFTELRGSYIGAVYDLKKNLWIIFHDQLGGAPLYYATTSSLHISSDITALYRDLQGNDVKLHLDNKGVQMVLELGFGMTIDGYTLCEEVKKVHPGCYLISENGKLTEKPYYAIVRKEEKLSSENEYLDMIDEAYKEAVRRQFGKDDEYGYKTITCLSGGVDSRMMVWISHQLGWTKQLNITFSNSGWYDETVARQIAKDLNHEWLFKPIEDANFMYQIDESNQITGGSRSFHGVMHLKHFTSLINFEGAHLGVLHTGSQGEVLKGEAVVGGELNKNGNYYVNYLKQIGITPGIDYSDPEISSIMNKYLNVDQDGCLSPLLELDFFETTLKIPADLRKDEYIYKQWIMKKHPDANKYPWATTGVPYGSKKFNPMLPIVHCHLYQLPKYINYKLGGTGFALNPYNMFYEQNKGLEAYYNDYTSYLDAISNDKTRSLVRKSFDSNDIYQKMKAVTILSAVKLFFS